MQKNFGESTKRKNESLRIQYWANCGMLCSNSVPTNASRCIFCDLMHDFSPHDFIFRPSVLRYNPFYLNTLRVNASRNGIFSALNPLENDWNRNWYYSVRQQSYCESCGFASYFNGQWRTSKEFSHLASILRTNNPTRISVEWLPFLSFFHFRCDWTYFPHFLVTSIFPRTLHYTIVAL